MVNHEKSSWDEAVSVAYGKLRSGDYAPYGAEKNRHSCKTWAAKFQDTCKRPDRKALPFRLGLLVYWGFVFSFFL